MGREAIKQPVGKVAVHNALLDLHPMARHKLLVCNVCQAAIKHNLDKRPVWHVLLAAMSLRWAKRFAYNAMQAQPPMTLAATVLARPAHLDNSLICLDKRPVAIARQAHSMIKANSLHVRCVLLADL